MVQTLKIPQWTLADRMRKARREAGMTPEEMADALQVSAVTVRNYETERTRPSHPTLVVWAQVSGVPLEWLRYGDVSGSAGAEEGPEDAVGGGATPIGRPVPGGLPAARSRCFAELEPPRLPGAGAGVWMGTASLLAAVAAPPPRDVPVPSRSGRRRIDDHQVEVRVA